MFYNFGIGSNNHKEEKKEFEVIFFQLMNVSNIRFACSTFGKECLDQRKVQVSHEKF